MEHFLQNAMKWIIKIIKIIKIRGAILSPRPHLALDIKSVEMSCYAAQVLDGRDRGPQEGSLPSLPAGQLHSRNPWVALRQQQFCSKYSFLALLLNHTATLEMPGATTLAKGLSPPLQHRAQQPVTEKDRKNTSLEGRDPPAFRLVMKLPDAAALQAV